MELQAAHATVQRANEGSTRCARTPDTPAHRFKHISDCPGCQEGQRDPVVHQEECGQQVEGGSPPPLLCPSEAPSAVLCPVLGSPVQVR